MSSSDQPQGKGTSERRPAGPVSDSGLSLPGESSESLPPAGGDVQDGAQAVEADFEKLLADVSRERDEYLELAKRTKADFENFRKRMSSEVEAASAKGKAALVGELVHVVDNLERALEAATDSSAGPGPQAAEPLVDGIRLTHRDLCMALTNHGVEVVDPVGERFDPSWHEALTTKPSQDHEPGIVISTERKGYRLGDQLIRPALVIVSE